MAMLILLETSDLIRDSSPNKVGMTTSTITATNPYMEQDNKHKDQFEMEQPKKESTTCKKVKRCLRSDLTIWDKLITIAHFMFWCGDGFSYFLVAVRLDYLGFSKDQIVVTMAVRGAVGLARIIPSCIIDRYKLNTIKIAAMCTFLMGAVAMVSVTLTSFISVFVYFIYWGFMQCK